jgi:hypothetical protein
MITKSHSFVVKKANGINDFRIQLRESHSFIHSEKALRIALEKAIQSTSGESLKNSLLKKYADNHILDILRFYGILAASKRIIS